MNTIAIIFGERGGSSYHRQLTPHTHLSRAYKNEFEVLFKDFYTDITEEELKKIKLIQYSRMFGMRQEEEDWVKAVKARGIVVVLDMDDHWVIPKELPHYYNYIELKLTERILRHINIADHVTTTTQALADQVEEATDSIIQTTVIPNAIDQDIPQFRPALRAFDEDFIKFGWLGSMSHGFDVGLMAESFRRLHKMKDLNGKWQLILGGFNMDKENTTVIMKDKEGRFIPRSISPLQTIWGIMERVFTDDFKMLRGKEEYLKYLGRYTPEGNEIAEKMPYRRVWSEEVTRYMKIYNELDVVLIPLQDSLFNRLKSELKLIEAAFFGKAVIISDIHPYSPWLKDGVNCLKVRPGKEGMEFYTAMRKLINDPSEIARLGRNLREDMVQHFNMDKIGKIRAELYSELIRKHNAN